MALILRKALADAGYSGILWADEGGYVFCQDNPGCRCAECCGDETRLGVTGRLNIG